MKKLLIALLLFTAGIAFSQTSPVQTEDKTTNQVTQVGEEENADEVTQADDETEETPGDVLSDEELSSSDVLSDERAPSSETVKRPPFWTTEQDKEVAYEFPQWAKDLRRGEIIAFGAFPIMVFFSRMFVDIYRSASHGWDNNYAPWPFTGPNSVGLTDNDVKLMFSVAALSSVAVAVADHFIIKHKRKKR
jgi:hypothetical protein